MTTPETKARELKVFLGFERASRQQVDLSSVQQGDPPLPDIVCRTETKQLTGFELVEILDEDMARTLCVALDLKKQLLDAYEALPEAERKPLQCRVALLKCRDDTSSRNRRESVPAILSLIKRCSPECEGMVSLGPDLSGVIEYIHVAPTDIPYPLFEVSSFGSYGDPVITRIEKKFTKVYRCDGPLDLVAYYDLQDSLPIETRRDRLMAFLRENGPKSRFRRVWVYDHRKQQVLLVYPEDASPGVRVLKREL